jgi:hypothetical protein
MKTAVMILILALALFASHLSCDAAESGVQAPGPVSPFPSQIFTKDRLSAQFVAGALFGPVTWIRDHPALNYAQTNLRFGWMTSDLNKTRYFGTGNIELLFELSNSQIFKGFGEYVRGFTLLGRYNFLLSDSGFVPYLQVGAGAVVTDAYKDNYQGAIGQCIEFALSGSLGLRYVIDRHWSLDGEAMLHHISNAGLNERNGGANAVGGFVGLTYYFDRLWR